MNESNSRPERELWTICGPVSPYARVRLIQESVNIVPAGSWERSYLVGRVRVLVAEFWQTRMGEVTPFLPVSQPLRVEHSLRNLPQFRTLAACKTLGQFAGALRDLLRELNRAVQLAEHRQLTLFDE